MYYLGIDTSNYTTSCAVYDSDNDSFVQKKRLLPVKHGEKGLRQSDAVFYHTSQLSLLIGEVMKETSGNIAAVGSSDRPRDVEGSYMPCFNVGFNTASAVSSVIRKPLYTFSHQTGHIMSALFSSGRTDLTEKNFIAFHVSGGTTEALFVRPDKDRIFSPVIIGITTDINCGQAIDRVGVMLGLDFPCGRELELIASKSVNSYNPKICVKDGNCSLSGLENICRKMFESGEKKEDIARFCIDFISKTIKKMCEYAVEVCGNLPLILAGGVMSNQIIKHSILSDFDAYFAEPEFSCDNAAGVAYSAFIRSLR